MIEVGATCPSGTGRDASLFPIRWHGVGISAGPWSGPTTVAWTQGSALILGQQGFLDRFTVTFGPEGFAVEPRSTYAERFGPFTPER